MSGQRLWIVGLMRDRHLEVPALRRQVRNWRMRALAAEAKLIDVSDGTHPCHDCRRTYYERMGSYWLADDELWATVVGDQSIALCPACFVERARKVGLHIHWRPEVWATAAASPASPVVTTKPTT